MRANRAAHRYVADGRGLGLAGGSFGAAAPAPPPAFTCAVTGIPTTATSCAMAVTAPSLVGTGAADFSTVHQLGVQAEGMLITIVWSGIVALVAYQLVDMVLGLRVSEEDEREGLDITSHGETAYNR